VKTLIAVLVTVGLAAPAAAQSRRVSSTRPDPFTIRPFFLVTGQEFTAKDTFTSTLGSRFQPFWGGGVQLTFFNRIFVDVTASRFQKTGQRAFRLNGQTYKLGIPLKVRETPLEFTAGYRFHKIAHVVPYVGGGVGTYQYSETSDFADPGDNVDARHAGAIAVAGAEGLIYRKWIRLGVDVQYTYIPGILGDGGISAAVASGDHRERDLGGVAARLRVIVGK
jgi:outer membrane protein W